MRETASFCKPVVWVIALLLAAFGASVSLAAHADGSAPWREDFEGVSAGPLSLSWWGPTSNSVVVTNYALTYATANPYPDAAHTNALWVPQDTAATNYESSAVRTNVWIDFWIQPNLYDGAATNRAVDFTPSALFFFSTNGYTYAQWSPSPTTNWHRLSTDAGGGAATPISGTNMIRVTVHLDYASHKYALFVEDQMLCETNPFVNVANSAYSSVTFQDYAWVDNLSASWTNYPDGKSEYASGTVGLTGDANGDGLGDAWQINYFGSTASTNAQGNDDPDGDGRSNSQEWDDGTNPMDGNSAAWTVPYYERFAQATLGALTNTWHSISKLGAGQVQFVTNALTIMADSKAMMVSSGGLTLAINDTTATNVFCQLYVKPVTCATDPDGVVDREAAAICVLDRATSNLRVYAGSGWTNTTRIPTVPTNQWLGLAVHMDYTKTNWDLYVSTNGNFALHMEKANPSPLPFNTNCTSTFFTALIITNESSATAYVDAVAISLSYTNCQSVFTNLAIFERLAGEEQPTSIPPYAYASADANLGPGAQLGRDLSIGLMQSDKLRIFTTNQWKEYKLTVDRTWQLSYGSGALNGSDLTIGGAQGLIIVRQPGSDTLAFYPYGGTMSPAQVSNIVYGTDNGTFRGKTDLALPASYPRCIDINSVEFLASWAGKAAVGDEILFFDPVSNKTIKFNWNGSQWLAGATVKAWEICPGDAFLYYKTTSGTFQWVVTN